MMTTRHKPTLHKLPVLRHPAVIALAVLMLSLAALGHAAEGVPAAIDPQGNLITNPQAAFTVTATVNRNPNGSSSLPIYLVGDSMTVTTTSTADAFLYFIGVDAHGSATLLPGQRDATDDNGFVRANEVMTFPGDGRALSVAGPAGKDRLVVFASRKRLDEGQLAQVTAAIQFAASQKAPLPAAMLTVTGLEPTDWATTTTAFLVGTPPQTTGTVRIVTRPAGATIMIGDVIEEGPAPAFTLPAGTHTVAVSYPGYHSQILSIVVSAGTEQTVTVTLEPRPTTLRLRTNAPGARVFVDAELIGVTGADGTFESTMPHGNHEIAVLAEGYATAVTNTTTGPGEPLDLTITLQPR